jgi:tellurite resistance protein
MKKLAQLAIIVAVLIATATTAQTRERQDIKVDRIVSEMGLDIQNPSATRFVYRLIERGYTEKQIHVVVDLCSGDDGRIEVDELRGVLESMRRRALMRQVKQNSETKEKP